MPNYLMVNLTIAMVKLTTDTWHTKSQAKTGWQGKHGWWVEWPTGQVFFVLNLDTPERGKDLYKRQAIVRDVLSLIEALPSKNH